MAPFQMANLIGKGNRGSFVMSEAVPQSDPESGSFLQESDRNSRLVGEKNDGDNPFSDEYRA